MDKKRLKVGIIGCGGIANGKHMPSIKAVNMADMVAFCDLIEERAVKAAKEYGVPGAKVYTDYKELLADPEIDVVHVCTPNRSHADISIDAMHAGKHVMCEKPMAKSAADARRMVAAAKETGAIVTTEEANVLGGLGAAVAEYLSENYPVPVVRHGVNDEFGHSGPAGALLKQFGLSAEHIVEVAKDFCGK